MRKKIIISLLVCCVQLIGMESVGELRDQLFSIMSADGEDIPLSYKFARHMKIFYPINSDNCRFRSQHTTQEIGNFLKIVKKINDKTVDQSCFPAQYAYKPTKTKRTFNAYRHFDDNLNQDASPNRKTKELMSVARELKDEQALLVLISFFIEKKYHDNIFSTLMSRSQAESFYDEINEICKNTYEPSLKLSNDFRDELVPFSKAKQKKAANAAGTMVATIDEKQKGLIVVHNSTESVAVKLWNPDIFFSTPVFSGDGSRFACIENVQGNYRNGFLLFVWDVATWNLLIDARFLLSGEVHTMCLNQDGTKLVASVKSKVPLCPEGGLYTSEYENLIIDMKNGEAEIIHEIPTHSIARSIYWRPDETFITSHTSDKCYQWKFKKRNENAGKDLNFIQKIFLYGLYERMQEEKRRYYPHSRKPFIIPEIDGYVKEYVMESLPKRLKRWAQRMQKKYYQL